MAQAINYAKISIHAFRVEGDPPLCVLQEGRQAISIHAFRVEGDSHNILTSLFIQISIHAFRVEGDK